MQRLQIQRFLHTKSLVNSIKPLHCGTMWYSTEGNGDKSTKITGGVEAAAVAKTVKPKRTLKDKIIDYFASSKSVSIQSQNEKSISKICRFDLLVIRIVFYRLDYCRSSGTGVRSQCRSIESHGIRYQI